MRIALIHSFYKGATPSGENEIVRLQYEALMRDGHEVEVFSRSTDDLMAQRGYALRSAARVIGVPERDFASSILAFRPDVVHIHNLFPNISPLWTKGFPAPIVATLHNFRPFCASGTLVRDGKPCALCPERGSHFSAIHRCYKGSVLGTIPLAIANSKFGTSRLVIENSQIIAIGSNRAKRIYEALGVSGSSLRVIPNFQEPSNVSESKATNGRWCFIGRLAPEKGILDLIEAWPQGHYLDIFGDGPDRKTIEQRATDYVRWMGFADPTVMREVISQYEGIVFPSAWPEVQPMAYVNALSVGRPAVALAGNTVADDIEASGTGLVVPNLYNLGRALEAVEGSMAFRKQALERFHEEFSEHVWLERTMKLYKDAISTYA